ncbi:MAG: hypothetical protein H6727_05630 [Myxococcales bacterium]|nr:hypothetical protein [Myxococcales bacterium]
MKCIGCGSALEAGVVFCKVCGKYNAQNKSPQTTPPPSATPVAPSTVAPSRAVPSSAAPSTSVPSFAPPSTGGFAPPASGIFAPPTTPPPQIRTGAPPSLYAPPSTPHHATASGSSQIYHVVEPFGEVNVYQQGQAKRIEATLLTYEVQEGTKTGIALDGSLSMKKMYGAGGGKSSFFATAQANEVEPIARQMCQFLAEEVDCRGQTTALYWACGPMGAEIESVGDVSVSAAEQMSFAGPKSFGRGTRLLPPLQHFAQDSLDGAFGMYVFITDGAIDDLEEVKAFTVELAKSIESGKRPPFKGVLIGLGPEVQEEQMIELDDLDTGTEVDIWDHKLAGNLRQMWDIFAEVVSRNQIIAPWGRILDQDLRPLKEYPNGLPTILEFEVPLQTTHIILEAAGKRAEPQPLF